MNLKQLHRQTVVEQILSCFKDSWATLVYDNVTYNIITSLFSKIDLLDYSITGMHSIEDKKFMENLPTIYFIDCTKEIGKKISEEIRVNKTKSYKVFSLRDPQGLDIMISYKVVNFNIEVIEERVFKCLPENLFGIENLVNCQLVPYYSEACSSILESINNSGSNSNYDKEAMLLILDRKEDLYTPLMHFFTFRTLLSDHSSRELNDDYYPNIKNLHVGEVGGYIQNSIKKLKEDLKILDSQNVELETLSLLVFDAPKNIETKKNIEKYSSLLNAALRRVENTKKIAEAEQDLVLEEDKYGNSVVFDLNVFFSLIQSAQYTFEEKKAFLYLLRTKNINFSESEKQILLSKGFKLKDIDITFDISLQLIRNSPILYTYDISRFESLFIDAVTQFLTGTVKLKNLKILSNRTEPKASSLRKSKMITFEKSNKRIVIVYIRNGICLEELKIPYILSEKLGAEIFIGSNKIYKKDEFVNEISTNSSFSKPSK